MTRYEDLPDVLNVAEAAALLRISRNTAYTLIQTKRLPAIRVGRKLMISKKAIIKMMEGEDAEDQRPGVGGAQDPGRGRIDQG